MWGALLEAQACRGAARMAEPPKEQLKKLKGFDDPSSRRSGEREPHGAH